MVDRESNAPNPEIGATTVSKPRGRRNKLQAISATDVQTVLQPLAKTLPATRMPASDVIEADYATLSTVDEYAYEVGRLWGEASRTFVQVGRRINQAKATLVHGEFMELAQQRLPFSIDIAERLMAIARAVDDGIYPETVLPPNWSVAHALVTLKDDERPKALEEGLVRPNVTRREIAEFKRRLRKGGGEVDERAAARRELAQLLTRMERDRKRLAELQALLGRELS
ncbi:hypothetical protein CRT60_03335 [Azospirillum palustre]|uniref:DUF3102 domain-containing protein n=1 Tax=Azospirillum palustre TaxID=2044885 RepID=A0A2B8BMP7_9PROT|nr:MULTISPECIES: DUF3102 domain-containing protein [Azospirillum]PGH59030.1 hypothetical protein CRT60_03335 [Azospirillum palustre]